MDKLFIFESSKKRTHGAVLKLINKFKDVKSDETMPRIDKLSNIASALQKKTGSGHGAE